MKETRPFYLQTPTDPSFLILSSPHSGREIPEDFSPIGKLSRLRQIEDAYVDELVQGGLKAGAAILSARYTRAYVDLNRAEDDLDPKLTGGKWPTPIKPTPSTLAGYGVVRRLCVRDDPLYEAPLPVKEVAKRLLMTYRPYHTTLESLIEDRVARFGHALLIDCHSMPSEAVKKMQPIPDFVLGNREGQSCAPNFLRYAGDILQGRGYTVSYNDPYKGVEILRRHARPAARRSAFQMEINRSVYMDEASYEKTPSFKSVQEDLTVLFQRLVREELD